MRTTHFLAFAGLAGFATLGLAADAFTLKPGLYHMNTSMTMGGAPMYVEGMNDAQRAQYAKSWAQNINKPEVSEDDDCISQKDIEEARLFKGMGEDDPQACKKSGMKQTASTLAGTIECTRGKVVTRSEMNIVAVSPTSFKGTIKITMTSPNGKTTMDATMSGTYKGASCPAGSRDGDDD
jgi:hypothetical protein